MRTFEFSDSPVVFVIECGDKVDPEMIETYEIIERGQKKLFQRIAALTARCEKLESALRKVLAHGCCVMHNDESCPGCIAKEALEAVEK